MSSDRDHREDTARVIAWLEERLRADPSDADVALLLTLDSRDPLFASDLERQRLEELASVDRQPLRTTRDLVIAGTAERLLRQLEPAPGSADVAESEPAARPVEEPPDAETDLPAPDAVRELAPAHDSSHDAARESPPAAGAPESEPSPSRPAEDT